VDEPLCQSDNKESIFLGVVIISEHSQVASESGVIGTRPDHSQSENGILSNLVVLIVGQFSEHVDGGDVGVGHSQESDGERHDLLDNRLSVSEQLVERSYAHFRAHIFAESDEGNSEGGRNLMQRIFFVSFMLGKQVQQLLDLENISSPGISHRVDQQFRVLSEVLV